MIALLVVLHPEVLAQETGYTGDTGPVFQTTGDTTPGTTIDTGLPFCADCAGAATLVGDAGGSPCDNCNGSSGTQAGVVLPLLGLFVARRRHPSRLAPVATTKRTSP